MTRPQTPGTAPAPRAGRGGDSASLPGARTMTPDQAAWVREHVWTEPMRRVHHATPHFYGSCACQWICEHCADREHRRCSGREPRPTYATVICRLGGDMFAYLPELFTHPTPTVGYRSSYAYVWLADRRCRWLCACDCEAAIAAEPVQLDLLAEVPAWT